MALKLDASALGKVGKVSDLVTGTVLAFLGTLDEAGTFVVADFCTPGLAPQRPLTLDPGLCLSTSTCVCLGVGVGVQVCVYLYHGCVHMCVGVHVLACARALSFVGAWV